MIFTEFAFNLFFTDVFILFAFRFNIKKYIHTQLWKNKTTRKMLVKYIGTRCILLTVNKKKKYWKLKLWVNEIR